MADQGSSTADAALNREVWTRKNAGFTDANAEHMWAQEQISWGCFSVPEATVGALGDLDRLAGVEVVELGCGTAYFSGWLARRGARPTGVDVTPAQLVTARRCQDRFDQSFPLIEADATAVPLPDASFDLAISEYGASLWCEPRLWLAEAYRLLRPGGRLVFLTNSPLVALCWPGGEGVATESLQRAQRAIFRMEWEGEGVEFHPGHGEWLALLGRAGFAVEALHELYAPDDAPDHQFYDVATAEWARMWPVEDLWVTRRDERPLRE